MAWPLKAGQRAAAAQGLSVPPSWQDMPVPAGAASGTGRMTRYFFLGLGWAIFFQARSKSNPAVVPSSNV